MCLGKVHWSTHGGHIPVAEGEDGLCEYAGRGRKQQPLAWMTLITVSTSSSPGISAMQEFKMLLSKSDLRAKFALSL